MQVDSRAVWTNKLLFCGIDRSSNQDNMFNVGYFMI